MNRWKFLQVSALALGLAMLPGCAINSANEPAQRTAGDSEASSSCHYGQAHSGVAPEFKQFQFLIGDFIVTSHAWTGADWSPPRPGPRARWNGRYGLGGMVIYDEWFDPDPALDPDAPRGVNVRMYDDREGLWKMMWVATSGRQVVDLRAQLRDGILTMWQVHPELPGSTSDFHVTDEDHWQRITYSLDDGGKRLPQYKLAATRIPCSDNAAR